VFNCNMYAGYKDILVGNIVFCTMGEGLLVSDDVGYISYRGGTALGDGLDGSTDNGLLGHLRMRMLQAI